MTTHIDLSELTKMSDGDEEFIKEVIEILVLEVPENLKNIELYVLNEDITSLKKLIHKMKSSFMLVGMKALSPIAENIGKSTSTETIIGLVPQYVEICKKSLAELLVIQNNLNRDM
jgi:HPt (histidine-containing phosphotransfer) domain-containing protein